MAVGVIIETRPDLKAALDRLALETHRSEVELANEAVESYLETNRRYVGTLKQRIADADAGSFASGEEAKNFFAKYGEPG